MFHATTNNDNTTNKHTTKRNQANKHTTRTYHTQGSCECGFTKG